jgi:parvulin-like peptidyl-prolyl isomerase
MVQKLATPGNFSSPEIVGFGLLLAKLLRTIAKFVAWFPGSFGFWKAVKAISFGVKCCGRHLLPGISH